MDKIIKNDRRHAIFGDSSEKICALEVHEKDFVKVRPMKSDLEQTVSHKNAASAVAKISENQKTFMFRTSASEVVWRSYGAWKIEQEKQI